MNNVSENIAEDDRPRDSIDNTSHFDWAALDIFSIACLDEIETVTAQAIEVHIFVEVTATIGSHS